MVALGGQIYKDLDEAWAELREIKELQKIEKERLLNSEKPGSIMLELKLGNYKITIEENLEQ